MEQSSKFSKRAQSHSAIWPSAKHIFSAAAVQMESSSYGCQRSTPLVDVANLFSCSDRHSDFVWSLGHNIGLWVLYHQSYRSTECVWCVAPYHIYRWAQENACKGSYRGIVQSRYKRCMSSTTRRYRRASGQSSMGRHRERGGYRFRALFALFETSHRAGGREGVLLGGRRLDGHRIHQSIR
jgi:hypothetical protein